MSYPLLRVLPCALLLALGAAPSAHAGLVKRPSKAEPAQEPPLVESFAKLVSSALEQPIAADALDDGLPVAFVKLIEASYEGDTRARVLEKYRKFSREFEERWSAYEARRAEVDAAVQKAQALAKAKDSTQARQALEGVLTSISADDEGNIKVRGRASLEVMDAELPALIALAGLAVEQKDPFVLADIDAALYPRRRVMDKESERLMWLSAQEPRQFAGYGAGLRADASRAVQKVGEVRDVAVLKDGMLMAQGFYWNIDGYGVVRGDEYKKDSVKKGKWALFVFVPSPEISLKVSDDKLVMKANHVRKIPTNCKESDKIDGYDPIQRKFTYRQECDYIEKKIKVDLTAKLTTPPPDWTRDNSYPTWVIGKVQKQGLSWVLTDAQLVDYRFLGPSAFLDFGGAASTLF